MSDVEGRTYS